MKNVTVAQLFHAERSNQFREHLYGAEDRVTQVCDKARTIGVRPRDGGGLRERAEGVVNFAQSQPCPGERLRHHQRHIVKNIAL